MAGRAGALGAALTIVGAAVVVVAFSVLDWLTVTVIDGDQVENRTLTLPQIRDERRTGGAAASVIVHDYLTWSGWTLLVLMTVAGLIGAARRPAPTWARWVGGLAGLAGAVVTWAATTRMFTGNPPAYTEQFPAHGGFGGAEFGAHLAFAGFLVGALGAASGPWVPWGGGVAAARDAVAPRWARARDGLATRVAASVLVVAGAVALGLAIHVLPWYDTTNRDLPERFTIYEIDGYARNSHSRFAAAYFPTLAWVFAVVALAIAVACTVSPRYARAGRWVSVGTAVVAVAATGYGLAQTFPTGTVFRTWHDDLSAGPWVLMVGYVLCAAASFVAARRRR